MKPDENFIKTVKKVEGAPAGRPPTYGTSMRQVSMIAWEERAEKHEAIKEPAVGRPTDTWEKRKVAGAGSGSKNNGHNSSLAKGKGFSHSENSTQGDKNV